MQARTLSGSRFFVRERKGRLKNVFYAFSDGLFLYGGGLTAVKAVMAVGAIMLRYICSTAAHRKCAGRLI